MNPSHTDDRYLLRLKQFYHAHKKWGIPFALTLIAVPFALYLYAAPVTIPNTFTAGTVVSSAQMNANFTAVATAVNDNNTRVTALEATKTGYAIAAAVTGVPRFATTSIQQTSGGGSVGVYAVAGGNDYVLCPIQLPQGAVVTQIAYLVKDNDATMGSTGWLYRSDQLAVASVGTTAGQASATPVWVSTALAHTVDNTVGGYYIYMQVDSTAGVNLAPIAFRVTYTYTN